ncbi:hypothetical protein [Parvibaculum sp.]|uniref:hypothetical protein n=1 Tax=Parvibaculum sp. TaxID=2024848 RepID=UPI001D53C245|nr:hypothetical protein [Parvibaculum sp.]MBX3490143.1 hypothetical protein [Parvibaculum sp.]MCW5725869.1 hypothetical protein [Parvibaculum sp.]
MDEYFHVIVRLQAKPSPVFLFGDLSERELQRRFVRPYQMGKVIVKGNELVDLDKVSSVEIIRTDKNKETCLRELQMASERRYQEMNADSHRTGAIFLQLGSGNEDEDIVEAGEDVTTRYINEGPGNGTGFLTLKDLLNNGWVVGLGTGIILAILGALFAT